MLDYNPYRYFYEFGKCTDDYTESLPDKVEIIVDAFSNLFSGGSLQDAFESNSLIYTLLRKNASTLFCRRWVNRKTVVYIGRRTGRES